MKIFVPKLGQGDNRVLKTRKNLFSWLSLTVLISIFHLETRSSEKLQNDDMDVVFSHYMKQLENKIEKCKGNKFEKMLTYISKKNPFKKKSPICNQNDNDQKTELSDKEKKLRTVSFLETIGNYSRYLFNDKDQNSCQENLSKFHVRTIKNELIKTLKENGVKINVEDNRNKALFTLYELIWYRDYSILVTINKKNKKKREKNEGLDFCKYYAISLLRNIANDSALESKDKGCNGIPSIDRFLTILGESHFPRDLGQSDYFGESKWWEDEMKTMDGFISSIDANNLRKKIKKSTQNLKKIEIDVDENTKVTIEEYLSENKSSLKNVVNFLEIHDYDPRVDSYVESLKRFLDFYKNDFNVEELHKDVRSLYDAFIGEDTWPGDSKRKRNKTGLLKRKELIREKLFEFISFYMKNKDEIIKFTIEFLRDSASEKAKEDLENKYNTKIKKILIGLKEKIHEIDQNEKSDIDADNLLNKLVLMIGMSGYFGLREDDQKITERNIEYLQVFSQILSQYEQSGSLEYIFHSFLMALTYSNESFSRFSLENGQIDSENRQ